MRSVTHQLDILAAEVAGLRQQLGTALELLSHLAEERARSSYTITEWRTRHKISESQYHKLRRERRSPRTMATGDIGVRISVEADREWTADREREAAARQKQQGDQQPAE
jgi:hypothetical protein